MSDLIPERSPNEPQAGVDGTAEFALVARAKDLLRLAEKDVRRAEESFEQLGFDTQLETALALTGDQLQEWLLLSEDCTDLVRALPPDHLHRAIRLLGDEEALAILKAASSAQMQAMMDIEWFSGNRLDRKKVRRWAELLMELDPEEVDEALQGIDVNALAQFLRGSVKPKVSKDYLLLAIHMNQAYLFTPDDFETRDDVVERFLSFLYAADRDYFGEVLELLIAEDEQIVDADMYAGREDRMIKRGFPALAKAEALLEIIDVNAYHISFPKAASLDEAEKFVTTALQTKGASAPFLLHALAYARSKGELSQRAEHAFIRETTEIANSLLLAHARDSTESSVKKSALGAVQVVASLGLEAVTSGNVIAAAERLLAMDMVELFQLGWSLARMIAKDAWDLVNDPRIEKTGLARNLKWLPAHLRQSVRDAEEFLSWQRIAATYTQPDEAEQKQREILEKLPVQELLTWPRLCALHLSVEMAKEELDIQMLALKARS